MSGFPNKIATVVLVFLLFELNVISALAGVSRSTDIARIPTSEMALAYLTFSGQNAVSEFSFSEGIERGRNLQRLGQYEEAITVYQAVLGDAPEDSLERIEASFSLGETQLLAGNYSEAAQSLLSFVENYPEDQRKGQAVFMAGRAYQSIGRWSEAITQYQTYLSIDDTVAPFIYEVMGDCYLAAKDYSATIDAYRRGLDGPIDRLMRIHLLEGIAEAQTLSADYDGLVESYDEILKHAQGTDYRAKTEYLAAQALAAAGKTEESHTRYFHAVETYPTAYHAYLSLIELVNAGYPVDEFQRGLVDYYSGAYTPAVQAFDRYIQSDPEGYEGEAHYYSGLSYEEAGNYNAAIEKFDALIENYPESKYLGDAWIAKGRTLWAMGSWDKAAEQWAELIERYPANPSVPKAFWLSGELWEEQSRYKEAIYNYTELQKRHPDFEQAAEALYRAGLSAFRIETYDKAITAWTNLVEQYQDSPFRPGALYWLGRTFHEAGDDERARAYLAKLREAYPRHYYAVRGQELEKTWNPKLFQLSVHKSMLLSLPTAEEQIEAENWLLGWSSVQPAEGESVSQLSESLAQDGRLQRGLILWTLDLTDDAMAQIRALKSDINDSPLELYRLGLYLQQNGLYRLAVNCLERVISLAPVDQQASIPSFLLKLTHPFHFDDLLVAEAVEAGIDPLLLLALVRQESSFEWHVRSWAGAQGLMQVMPATAEWIALQIGWTDFSNNLIYRPHVNVQFGTWYLARQLASFDNDIFAALIAYNAGPGRVMRWQTPEMAKDDDLFLEYIPLDEPRLYIEKVYTHYNIYRKLYADK